MFASNYYCLHTAFLLPSLLPLLSAMTWLVEAVLTAMTLYICLTCFIHSQCVCSLSIYIYFVLVTKFGFWFRNYILGTTCCILVLICITCTVYIYLYADFVILVLILFNIYTSLYLMSSPLYNVMYVLYSCTRSWTLNI